MSRIRIASCIAAVACALAVLVVACQKHAAPAAEETRLLVIDGIEIHFADVEPYVAFLDAYIPEGGRKSKIQRVIENHILPLFVARRAFGEQRKKLLTEAQQLCSLATNVYELDKQTEFMANRKRSNQTRRHPYLPVAMFFFDPLKTGSVSPPIEVPQGWFVAAAFDLHPAPLTTDDYVDGLQVGFVTHTDAEWLAWYGAEKQRLADKATFVHPDYREAIPPWIHLPKQP